MTSGETHPTQVIWATRGHSWGFRFLADGGFADPLPEYERAFAGTTEGAWAWRRDDTQVALRFPDPLERRDSAGRVIPHEFVLSGALADAVTSAEQCIQLIWPLVEQVYAQIWDSTGPPAEADIHLDG